MVESASKTKVSRDQAATIVCDAFGPTVGVVDMVEFTDGWFNAAYSLQLDDGRNVVLKVAPPPGVAVLGYEHDILHAEIDALRIVRDRTDVPVPVVLWVDEATRLPSASFLMSHVEGISLRQAEALLDADRRADLDRRIGRDLRAIHDITATAFGLLSPAMPEHATWSAAFGEMLEMLLRDGERVGVELPIGYGDVREVLARSVDALDEVATPRLVLWDLWAGNVMVDADELDLTGYLDFERALWGDPLLEAQFTAPGPSSAFVSGYGVDLLASPGARHRRELYTLYLHLVMSIEGTYRQYPEDPIGDRARALLADDLERCRAGCRP